VNPPHEVRVLAAGAQALTAPGFRVRVLLLRPELLSHGVRVDPLPLFEASEASAFAGAGPAQRATVLLRARRRLSRRLSDRERAGEAVALIQRQVDLLPQLTLERRAAKGRRLVWDVDDAIWLDASPAARGHRLAVLKGTGRKVRWYAERADEIVTANVYLADYLSRFSSRVTIVPSVVETRGVAPRRHANADEIVLGWIGSATTAPYLRHLMPTISRAARELRPRKVRLVSIGATMPTIDGVEVESRAWTLDSELEGLLRIDVGLMPMPDDDWTRGKSAYKALQYMSAGIPVVADDVGVASSALDSGRAGLIVRSETAWLEALVALAGDPGFRGRLGDHGRRHVEERFSVERWAPVVASIIRGNPAGPATQPVAERAIV